MIIYRHAKKLIEVKTNMEEKTKIINSLKKL